MQQANVTRMRSLAEPASTADGAMTHPEEIRWEVELRVGDRIGLHTSLRTTPAGSMSAGIMISAATLGLAVLMRARRRLVG